MYLLCSCFVSEIFDFLSLFPNNGPDHGGWHKNPDKRKKIHLVHFLTAQHKQHLFNAISFLEKFGISNNQILTLVRNL